jgi:hypothetical protein
MGDCAMDMSSPEMKDILEAAQLPDKQAGRVRLLALWETLSPGGTPLQLCSLAHILADTETEAALELEWDLRALEAATGSREAEDRETLPPVPESFLPSMHLSVSEGYRRLGELDLARRHLLVASNHMATLADDPYGALIRGGLRRLPTLLGPA